MTAPQQSKYGIAYRPLDDAKIAVLSADDFAEIERVRTANTQSTLAMVARFRRSCASAISF